MNLSILVRASSGSVSSAIPLHGGRSVQNKCSDLINPNRIGGISCFDETRRRQCTETLQYSIRGYPIFDVEPLCRVPNSQNALYLSTVELLNT